MAPKKMDQDGLVMKSAIGEDDVEGHGAKVRSAPDGLTPQKRSAIDEADVEGHGAKGSRHPTASRRRSGPSSTTPTSRATARRWSAPDGVTPQKRSAIDEDDVEGHGAKVKSAPDGLTPQKRSSSTTPTSRATAPR